MPSSLSALRLATLTAELTLIGVLPEFTRRSSAGPPPVLVACMAAALVPALFALIAEPVLILVTCNIALVPQQGDFDR